MALYWKGLKTKVQSAIILIKNADNIKKPIN